ncbi:MAG: hypothetical protein Ct9H300mP4_03310 [Gammaproteobacteria bacterium]|nr:MAG: hypothetical protein Ct9H300mP4_03310 [Gammaproteobacteria bacterium]
MHASLWLNPKPGTDSALAMAMVEVIIKENLYQEAYIKEQSDLPLLVRTDSKEFLRSEHLSLYGLLAVADNVYYMWDEATDTMVKHLEQVGPTNPLVGIEENTVRLIWETSSQLWREDGR